VSPGTRSGGNAAIDTAARAVIAGQRRALARAITLIESARTDDRPRAEALLNRLLPHAGKSIRIGISGAPGVGKSSFIEAFGLHLIAKGHRLAVLAVDPTSPRSGGSILGDKTRMEELAKDERAFIRPSPSRGALGGVARRTREAMLACEAAGFDVIVIETVGVGQSEIAVADMVDMFLLLLAPGGGDELQGIKRGIVEMSDAIIVTKCDGDLAKPASRIASDYRAALHLLRPRTADWTVPVLTCSALEGKGIDAAWTNVTRYRDTLGASGALAARRAAQAESWLWSELREGLIERFRDQPGIKARLALVESEVRAGKISPAVAARALLDDFARKSRGK
jgi:LAO/AO transport system kinase